MLIGALSNVDFCGRHNGDKGATARRVAITGRQAQIVGRQVTTPHPTTPLGRLLEEVDAIGLGFKLRK